MKSWSHDKWVTWANSEFWTLKPSPREAKYWEITHGCWTKTKSRTATAKVGNTQDFVGACDDILNSDAYAKLSYLAPSPKYHERDKSRGTQRDERERSTVL